jgi:penicillin-binding protein 2
MVSSLAKTNLGDFISFDNRRTRRRSRDDSGGPDVFLRLSFIRLVLVTAFLVLLAAIIRTQLFAGAYYRELANGNRIRQIPIHAPRGIIYDRNEIPLTANLPSFRLNDQTISKDQAISLEASGKLPEGQNLEIDSSRSYLFGPAFAHVLGYVSEIDAAELKAKPAYALGDKIGRGGVEEQQEATLRGLDGRELAEVDALGKKLRVLSTVPPVPGKNIRLSIDAALQQAAFREIAGKKAAVVATDPQTGEVLALVSTPSFDPNVFTDLSLSGSDRARELGQIFTDPAQPLFDRAIAGTYPPGSTFKIVTATAGLETGAISATTLIEDTGVLVVGPYKFPNWKWLAGGGVEGNLDVVGAIQKSNDIFFYKVGELVGIDDLVAWAKKYGLGGRLGIDLPGEAAGLVRNDRDWYLGDTYHTAIGQGDLLVTPLQDNTWTNVIASGGKLCRPHVAGAPVCRDMGLKPETVSLIRRGMMAACAPGGTAYPLYGFKVNGKTIALACKTGTAEYGDTAAGKTHAWLTVFAPAEKPEITLTVLVEGGGEGSDVAAPIAKKILEKFFSP